MKIQYKYLIVPIFLVISFCKKVDNYPKELKLVEINKGIIKAYTQQDSIIPNHFSHYDIVDSLYFNSILVRKISFRSHNSALLSLIGEGYLNLNAEVSYCNDSIIFKMDDTIDGNRITQELRGIGDEQ